MKSKGTAYFLWCGCFIGFCGLHRLYIGKIGTGLIWLFTLGLLGVGQFIDLFTLGGQVDVANLKQGAGVQQNVAQNVVVNVQTPAVQPSPQLQQIANVPVAARLKELNTMRDEGLITSDEYDAKRRDIIAGA